MSREFNIVDKEQINNESLKSLEKKYLENHKILLKMLKSNDFPFFALHGTTDESAQSILNTKKTDFIQVGTFFNKIKSEERLLQLYGMCEYVSGYGRRRGENSVVMLFNVEELNKDLNNDLMQDLLTTGPPYVTYLFPKKFQEFYTEPGNSLKLSTLTIGSRHFSTKEICKGVFNVEKYNFSIDTKNPDEAITRAMFRGSFKNQEILYLSFINILSK